MIGLMSGSDLSVPLSLCVSHSMFNYTCVCLCAQMHVCTFVCKFLLVPVCVSFVYLSCVVFYYLSDACEMLFLK